MVSNHLSTVDVIHKFTTIKNISTDRSQLLVTPTGQTTGAMALKLSDTILLLKVYSFKVFQMGIIY